MSTIPTIHASIAVSPVDLHLGEAATLTVTATLTYTRPITIFTWGTILDSNLSLSQGYKCTDLDMNASVAVETCKRRRGPFHHDLGGSDDVYFLTLMPGEITTFSGKFPLAQAYHKDTYRLTAGHRYRFEPRRENVVHNWWNGEKEEIMSPPGQRAPLQESSGPPIRMNSDVCLEFGVSEEWTTV